MLTIFRMKEFRKRKAEKLLLQILCVVDTLQPMVQVDATETDLNCPIIRRWCLIIGQLFFSGIEANQLVIR